MNLEITSKRIKIFGSYALAGIIAIILFVLLWSMGDRMAWLAVALGMSIGWPIGVLLSPYQSEQTVFKEYGKIALAFITGFLVSKGDRVFDSWIDRNKGHALFDEQLAARWMMGLAGFMLAMVLTYVTRKYVRFGPGADPIGK